jgi:hypothetical protein
MKLVDAIKIAQEHGVAQIYRESVPAIKRGIRTEFSNEEWAAEDWCLAIVQDDTEPNPYMLKVYGKVVSAPRGIYQGEFNSTKTACHYRATGEFRPPKKGEFYLSGAIITAYQAPNDLTSPHWIGREVFLVGCPHCNGTGKVEKK